MRESSEALRVDGQRFEEWENCKLSTFTARIHSVRSSTESALHSRRTLGFWQAVVFAATAADTSRERRNTRTMLRKEDMCEQRRGREEGESG